MASSLSHNFLPLQSLQVNTLSKSQTLAKGHCFARLRIAPKSFPQKNSTTSLEASSPKPTPPQDSSSSVDSSTLLRRFRNEWLKLDILGMDILSIALPAVLALAADPIASLVDTAFVGHIGNSMEALIRKEEDSDQSNDNEVLGKHQSKMLLPSVSTSLLLAASLGIAEAVTLCFGSGILVNIMGIPADSPMHAPAEQFLTLRAFGAPPVVIALAAQGTFRGFLDTKTPLYAIGAGNLLNAILDVMLIFTFGLGISGAAIATVTSEYLIAFILLWKLSDKVLLIPSDFDGRKIFSYLKSGGLLTGRTMAVLVTITLATSMAARLGPVPMAGHQICMQVWLSMSLLTDALALAGQALLAGDYSQGNYEQARLIVYRVLQIGLVTGIALSMILFPGFGAFSSLFSTDSKVLDIAQSGLLFVAGSQPVNALAFVIDGLYYGVSDFEYAFYSMLIVGLISSVFLLVAAPVLGLPGVWTGLFLFMTLRVLAGAWRLSSKSGPWNLVWHEDGTGD
ncbi:protein DETOXIFICATION 44, chloroplastic isoform X2 [Prosopis cineraria]|uniref:protein DETOXIFICATION 44, chloroplastic isoform X2 n=1 Tax=Prosopis cineraria TaxID=364024 RepID=UPI00240F02CF|nr:protein DETOXIFICATION 44, chloroplastic isoform X2 [Prosopis cineraria]